MKSFDELDLRDILSRLGTPEPPPGLVSSTKALMHSELLAEAAAPAPARSDAEIFILLGVTVAVSFCLFYMFTVGTVLQFIIPPEFLSLLRHSLYGLTALGGSMLLCTLSIICIRQFWLTRAHEGAVRVRV